GATENHPALHTLIEHWNGIVWSIVTSPATTLFAHLHDVTCASASDCWAVGDDSNETLTEHWNGTAWSIVNSSNAPRDNYLRGVTCTSASDCWAVGDYFDNDVINHTLIERYTAGPLSSGYTVTLQQVGPNVVATGSGTIDLTGLTFSESGSLSPEIRPNGQHDLPTYIYTGPISSSVDFYYGPTGPWEFGSRFVSSFAGSGSGNMVGIRTG